MSQKAPNSTGNLDVRTGTRTGLCLRMAYDHATVAALCHSPRDRRGYSSGDDDRLGITRIGLPIRARPFPARSWPRYGEKLYETVVSIELSWCFWRAAATAGAICLERPGHPRPHAGHRPVQRRDRPGQAGRATGAGARLDRLRLAHHGPGELLGGIDPTALFGSFLTAIGCACWAVAGLDPVGLGREKPTKCLC